jgi:hypothetical protein
MSKSQNSKVTVQVPLELLEMAMSITGLGKDSTIRLGLATMATHPRLGNSRPARFTSGSIKREALTAGMAETFLPMAKA